MYSEAAEALDATNARAMNRYSEKWTIVGLVEVEEVNETNGTVKD